MIIFYRLNFEKKNVVLDTFPGLGNINSLKERGKLHYSPSLFEPWYLLREDRFCPSAKGELARRGHCRFPGAPRPKKQSHPTLSSTWPDTLLRWTYGWEIYYFLLENLTRPEPGSTRPSPGADTTRTKRLAPFSIFGTLCKRLFGLATDGEVEKTHS